jgi:hypothetical protein
VYPVSRHHEGDVTGRFPKFIRLRRPSRAERVLVQRHTPGLDRVVHRVHDLPRSLELIPADEVRLVAVHRVQE